METKPATFYFSIWLASFVSSYGSTAEPGQRGAIAPRTKKLCAPGYARVIDYRINRYYSY